MFKAAVLADGMIKLCFLYLPVTLFRVDESLVSSAVQLAFSSPLIDLL